MHSSCAGGQQISLGGRRFIEAGLDGPLTIRLADTDQERNSARMLVNRMYGWRGYGDDHHIPTEKHYTTFTASTSDEDVVGTLTLGVDGPGGLAIDEVFSDEIDRFRTIPGTRVCELVKLAFNTHGPSKPLLASLFHIIFIYGENRYGCTDLFIEVNPRHVRFYEAMLGFRPIGGLRTNEKVAAPSQLMWLQISTIRERIAKEAAREGGGDGRSLYRFFFSPREARGIFDRLASSCGCHAAQKDSSVRPADLALNGLLAAELQDLQLNWAPEPRGSGGRGTGWQRCNQGRWTRQAHQQVPPSMKPKLSMLILLGALAGLALVQDLAGRAQLPAEPASQQVAEGGQNNPTLHVAGYMVPVHSHRLIPSADGPVLPRPPARGAAVSL